MKGGEHRASGSDPSVALTAGRGTRRLQHSRQEDKMAKFMGIPLLILATTAAAVLLSENAWAQSPRAERGRTFARANCATCHSIDKVSPSPLAIAPPFRTLHERYSVE